VFAAGGLADATGKYDLAFYAAGVVICMSGLILLLNPCLRPCDRVVARLGDSYYDISVDGADTKQKAVDNEDSVDDVDVKRPALGDVCPV